uniref:Translocon-associated protein subunit beta n=1 Tax=Piliocolobus tephrosceles TaxID=591936 RepID=A0A8C9GDN9_9PRIM
MGSQWSCGQGGEEPREGCSCGHSCVRESYKQAPAGPRSAEIRHPKESPALATWCPFRGPHRPMRLLAFVVLTLFAVTQAEEGARLLASKSLLNRYAVEGRDLTLQYNIYNVGSSAALDVELSDDSFPPEDFGIVSGMLNVKWDRIAPYPLATW